MLPFDLAFYDSCYLMFKCVNYITNSKSCVTVKYLIMDTFDVLEKQKFVLCISMNILKSNSWEICFISLP